MKNRNKEIYRSIPEGCNREPQLYKKAAETSDKGTRGWVTAEMPNTAIRAWNKTKPIPERSNRESQLLFHSAFTLIELLVVVLIIGILAAIALPQYTKAVEKAHMTEAITFMHSLQQATDLWVLENGYVDETIEHVEMTVKNATAFLDIDLNGLDCTTRDTECLSKKFAYSVSCDISMCSIVASRLNSDGTYNTGDSYQIYSYRNQGGSGWSSSCAWTSSKKSIDSCKTFVSAGWGDEGGYI